VESVGESVGVKTDGGVLEHVLFKIKVRALPKDLPEVIEVDVSALKIGDSIHLGDIKTPPGVELLGDKHLSVISVAAPITEEQEAALLEAAEGAPALGEVEMIKEKKEGEEGEEGAAAAPAGKGAVPGKAAPAAAGAAAAPGKAAPGKGAPGAAPAAAAPAAAAAKAPEKGKKKK
jgi:large subunit ribosomal protein L25